MKHSENCWCNLRAREVSTPTSPEASGHGDAGSIPAASTDFDENFDNPPWYQITREQREIRDAVTFGLTLLCAANQLPWYDFLWRHRMRRDGRRALKYARTLGWDELSYIDKDCTDNGTRIQQADREPRPDREP